METKQKSMKYLYGLVIDDMIYLTLDDQPSRSPAWKQEYTTLVDEYEPDASFVISEAGVLKIQAQLNDLSQETYDDIAELVGRIVIDGLDNDILDDLIEDDEDGNPSAYQDLDDYEANDDDDE